MYVANGLYLQGQGKAYGTSYTDIITPNNIDKRSGNEIAADVIERLGLNV